MTRQSLDRTPDRITLRHAARAKAASVRSDRSRHLWTLAGGVTGSLLAFWVMAQLGPASTDAQTTAPARSTALPPTVSVFSPAAKGEEEGSAALVPPAASGVQGPAIEIPREVIAMLDLRKRDLDRREQAVRQEEERLLVLKAELDAMLTRSEGMQKRMEDARRKMQKQTAEQKVQQDQFLADRTALVAKQSQEQRHQSQAQLAKMYESMPAEEAAARLEKMPERKAIEMLRLVNSKTAGAILAQMKVDRAAKLTEQLLVPAP